MPKVITTVPTIMKGLMRLTRAMIWPPMMPTAVMLRTSGVRTVPEPVAVLPSTPCTKSGVYRMTPNIPMPTMNIRSADEVKTRLLKSESGIMGSAALSSMGMKSGEQTAESTKPATTRVASQA